MILEVDGLSRKLNGRYVLDNISIKLEKGSIMGLLGPNGSGKTTLMKIIAGIQRPTSGSLKIDGERPGVSTKKIVSYLPDENHLYDWLRVKDTIKFFADFFEDFNKEKAVSLLKEMGIDFNKKLNQLSKGMLQVVRVCLVVSRKAKLYILDEPFNGIDIVAREKIQNIIQNSYNEESSVLITTHIFNEIERFMDHVVFISKGKKILEGECDSIRQEKAKSLEEIYKEIFANED